jgi:uncharacterized protein Yka (UPF0111/DUF47 family)
MKSRIVEQLGQAEILLPGLVAEGLSANDRAKVRMSALQAAAEHAHDPHGQAADLAVECRNAGVDAVATRSLIAGARNTARGIVDAPGLAKLGEALLADVATMIQAVNAGDAGSGKAAEDRFAAIGAKLSLGKPQIAEAEIAELTAVASGTRDSLHRLVMDLHKALNRLAAQCAEEVVAGAHTHGLHPDDKPLVAAFMRGLNRTRALKFNHPGLDTIAIRAGTRLVIQNDIGTTDAHVLLVAVEGLSVTITHTDVHEPRAKFFINLFDAFPVRWSGLQAETAKGLAKGEAFYLVTGNYEAESTTRRDAFLEAIGAALVFLIDWNKARKALRKLLSNSDAVRVLDWGARQEIGHRGFLELGGTELVASTVRHATPARIGFGEELSSVLGREPTVDFLKTALRLATDALRHGRSARSVREALEADLVGRIERTESALLTIVVRQMGLARDIAAGIAATLADQYGPRSAGDAGAARAKRIEKKADTIAVDARSAILRSQASATIAQLVDAAENTIDELEQAAFFASLIPPKLEPAVLGPLGELCAAAAAGTEAAARGLEAAVGIGDGESADSDDALAATERLVDLEHVADDAERAVTAIVLKSDGDARQALSVLELARALERATDRLSAMGHLLHDHVMSGLSG